MSDTDDARFILTLVKPDGEGQPVITDSSSYLAADYVDPVDYASLVDDLLT